MTLLGRITCYFLGHKRKKRWPQDENEARMGVARFRCPRCGATWTRTVKSKPAPAIPANIRKVGP